MTQGRVQLLLVCFPLVLFGAIDISAQTIGGPALPAGGPSLDAIVSGLALLRPRGVETMMTATGAAVTGRGLVASIATAVGRDTADPGKGVPILIGAAPCSHEAAPAPLAAGSVCALLFTTRFAAPDVNTDMLATLNAASEAHAVAFTAPDGKSSGVEVRYTYPCEGIADGQFVPSTYLFFTSQVQQVIAAYGQLESKKASPKAH